MILVGLAGAPGAGKSTYCKAMAIRHGLQPVPFATPMKETCQALFGLTFDQCWGDQKSATTSWEGWTAREVMQKVGLALRDVHPEVFLRAWQAKVKDLQAVVVEDVRYRNEAELIKLMGGEVWLVERPGFRYGEGDQHQAERDLLGWNFDQIMNSGGEKENIRALVEAGLQL